MESLFARYFDGDLDDQEARDFLDKVGSDPGLERELRAYERVLALGKEAPRPGVPRGLAERVLAELDSEAQPERSRRIPWPFQLRWANLAAAAAVVVLAYIGGWLVGRNMSLVHRTSREAELATTSTVYYSPELSAQAAAAGTDLRYVRLSYVPLDPSVERVSVAGSFNSWDPDATPLLRRNGVWITILVLHPGSYEYMFVENSEHWVTDPHAAKTRDDGFGGKNAVLDVGL
ncbi:MAG: hypothetical protein JSW03_00850 [Candidatus Eiseniibacteriota bacterium]|nr:MAG: hypothetical protein JSW03_00850 [Candidatus Eisenbacteria bacterium]